MRSALFIATFAATLALGSALTPHAASAQSACGSGYHLDGTGACQPDVGETNRYCPAGSIYHPAPNGYTCERPQTSASYERPQAPARRNAPRAIERAAAEDGVYGEAPRRAQRAYVEPRPTRRVAARKTRSLAVPSLVAQPSPTIAAPAGGAGGGGGSGGGGGGGGGGGWSDRRLKHDIVRLGASPSGLPIYAFQYVWGGPRYIGVMAQDLLKLRPDAVILDESGYYKVDYSRIDVKMREEAFAPL